LIRLCDQEDCPIYPYEIEKEPEPEPEPISDSSTISGNLIYNGSFSIGTISAWSTIATPLLNEESIRNIAMQIQIDELDIKIDIKCLMCKHFKKCDMKTELKVYEARKALEK